MKNIAVILSGSGYLDGAEIRESIFSLLALDEAGYKVDCFAPNRDQHHVVNHLDASEQNQKRNILEEAGRITRGEVKDLIEAKAQNYDALVIPGGFGVAKNLSDFAFNGSGCSVDESFQSLAKDFHTSKKPIVAICIAPAVLSAALKTNILVTIGNDEGTAAEIEKTGARHQNTDVTEICIDQENLIISTAAYMYHEARISDVNKGINNAINKLKELL